jgi:hypothetical protein
VILLFAATKMDYDSARIFVELENPVLFICFCFAECAAKTDKQCFAGFPTIRDESQNRVLVGTRVITLWETEGVGTRFL